MSTSSKKLSVIIIASSLGKTPEYVPYSFIFDEACRLANSGVEVHVIRSKYENDFFSYGMHHHSLRRKSNPEAIRFMFENIPKYPPASLLRRPKSIYWENLYALNVSKVVINNDVDLMHAHFAHPEGFIGVLAKNETKRLLVVTLHGGDINTVPEIGYGDRLRRGIDKLVRIVLRKADALICVSSDLQRKALELGASQEKMFTLFNAVDLNRFRPPMEKDLNEISTLRKSLEIGEDDFFIVNTRHLRPVYGLEYLVRSAKLVSKRIKNAKFVITGQGDLSAQLSLMIRSLGLQNNVKLIGGVPRGLIPKLMQASNLYINTNLSDGMPLSLLEAFSSGRPIVSFNVGGAKDIIDNNVNGVLVPPRNYRELASKIIWILENPDILREMGISARKKAEDQFDSRERTDRLRDIYDRIISQR